MEAPGNDLELPIERLNVEAMVQHKFISPHGHINFLPYMLTFSRASRWSSKKSERTVNLPAPSLFYFVGRENLSLTEGEVDAYIESLPPPVEVQEEEPFQQHVHDYEASSSSAPQGPNIGDGSGWEYYYPQWP